MDWDDKIWLIIFYIVIAINAVFIWMRLTLRKRGLKYSYIDFSWSVYYAFLDLMSRDRGLKVKLIRFIFIESILLILILTLL